MGEVIAKEVKVKRIHEIVSLANFYRETNNQGGIAVVVQKIKTALDDGATEEEVVTALKSIEK